MNEFFFFQKHIKSRIGKSLFEIMKEMAFDLEKRMNAAIVVDHEMRGKSANIKKQLQKQIKLKLLWYCLQNVCLRQS